MWKYDNLSKFQLELLDKGILQLGGSVDEEMAMYVQESLLRLKARGSPAIEVRITSNGGSVSTSLNIYDMLRMYPGEKTGIVEGFARSMAAVVLQACEKRKALKHCKILIHHISKSSVSLDVVLDETKLRELRADLEKDQARIYTIFSEKTKKNAEDVKAKCAEDTDMTAEEAQSFGLIDEIL